MKAEVNQTRRKRRKKCVGRNTVEPQKMKISGKEEKECSEKRKYMKNR